MPPKMVSLVKWQCLVLIATSVQSLTLVALIPCIYLASLTSRLMRHCLYQAAN